MKTVKTILLVTVLALATTAVSATGNLKAKMSQAGADKAVIEATNLKFELFEIEVEDDFGETLFSKTTEANAMYQRTYDFSALEDGVYHMTVKHGNEYYKKRFRIELGEVSVLDERKVVQPFFVQDGDHVKMSYLNYPKEEMDIYVYDANELLHEHKLGNDFAVNKAIDMSELRPGDYTIILATDFESFEHNITVD
jgi:hypothetical protein